MLPGAWAPLQDARTVAVAPGSKLEKAISRLGSEQGLIWTCQPQP